MLDPRLVAWCYAAVLQHLDAYVLARLINQREDLKVVGFTWALICRMAGPSASENKSNHEDSIGSSMWLKESVLRAVQDGVISQKDYAAPGQVFGSLRAVTVSYSTAEVEGMTIS